MGCFTLGVNRTKRTLPPDLQARVVGSVYQHAKKVKHANKRFGLIIQHVAKYGVQRWLAIEGTHSDWPEEYLANLVAVNNAEGLSELQTIIDLRAKLENLHASTQESVNY